MDWQTQYMLESIKRKINAIEYTINDILLQINELKAKLENDMIKLWDKIQDLQTEITANATS